MRKQFALLGMMVLALLAAACGGNGPMDPNNTMGPGMGGDDMRVASVDSTR
jgi:hypothetical protein